MMGKTMGSSQQVMSSISESEGDCVEAVWNVAGAFIKSRNDLALPLKISTPRLQVRQEGTTLSSETESDTERLLLESVQQEAHDRGRRAKHQEGQQRLMEGVANLSIVD